LDDFVVLKSSSAARIDYRFAVFLRNQSPLRKRQNIRDDFRWATHLDAPRCHDDRPPDLQ
jgi:hypothetical protein